MALIKCPRCELNYINEEEKICSVCRREVRGEPEQFEMIELCSECGEHPVVPGTELCAYCLKELSRRTTESSDEALSHEAASIGIDSVSTMDEIELDIDRDLDDDVFDDEDKEEFADDDMDDEDDEDKEED